MEVDPFRVLEHLDPAILVLIFVFFLGALVCQIFYLLTLHRTLEQVHPTLRKMSPGQVWLMFIPLFSIVWNFIMVGHIADSLAAEFRARNIPTNELRPGYQTGLWMCICPLLGFIPVIGIVGSIAGLVLWIMYWVRMSTYKKILEESKMNPPNPFMQQPTF